MTKQALRILAAIALPLLLVTQACKSAGSDASATNDVVGSSASFFRITSVHAVSPGLQDIVSSATNGASKLCFFEGQVDGRNPTYGIFLAKSQDACPTPGANINAKTRILVVELDATSKRIHGGTSGVRSFIGKVDTFYGVHTLEDLCSRDFANTCDLNLSTNLPAVIEKH